MQEKNTMKDINCVTGEQTNRLTKMEVLARAYAMPLASPAYTPTPEKFLDRPALTVSDRIDLDRGASRKSNLVAHKVFIVIRRDLGWHRWAQTEMSLSTVSVRGIGPMTLKRALGYFLSVASARASALTNLWRSNSPVAVCQCSFAGNNKSRLFIRKQQVLATSNVLGLAFMEGAFTIRLRRRAKRGT
jgi:hypothetical protein